MALRFLDSFDHYVTADLPEKWQLVSAPTISAGTGRRSTASLRITSSGNGIVKVFGTQPTWIVGCAFRFSVLPGGPSRLMNLWDGATLQDELRLNSSGTLSVTRNGTVLGTSTLMLTPTVYYYLEWRVTIHDTTGSYDVRVNGVSWLSATNVDTKNTATVGADSVELGVRDNGLGNTDYDDLYICDGTGTTNNTLLGDCRVDCLLPTGDGSNSAWTVSTGTTHSTLVDEPAPNDNTDYVSTATTSARDSYAMGDLPAMTAPVIYGLQQSSSLAKDDAGTRQVKHLLKSGATTVTGGTTHTLASSFTYYRDIWEQDPNTAAAWTTAAVNALEAGVEHV